LTIHAARKCVVDYGRIGVQEVLGKIGWRKDLRNPAGYFIKILKTDYKPVGSNPSGEFKSLFGEI